MNDPQHRRDGGHETDERALVRGIGALGAAQLATMLLNLAALVHIARTVGDVWFGVLQWGVAFSGYALIAAEWGLCVLGVRETARLDSPGAVRAYASVHLGLLLVLGAVVLLIAALALPALSIYRADPFIALAYLAAVAPFAWSLDWVATGLQRLGTVGAVKTLRSLLYAGAVLALLGVIDGPAGGPPARWVPLFFLGAWIVAAAVMAWRVRAWLGGWVRPRFGPLAEWRRRLRTTAPIGGATLAMRALLSLDVILLGILAAPEAVGNYAAAAKIVFVVIIAVEVVWQALLPRLARTWRQSRERCRRRFGRYLGLLLVLGLPPAVAGAVAGADLMALLYGDRFADAGAVCRILSVSYLALAAGQFLGHGLIASDRQRAAFAPVLAAAAVAVAAVLLLAPRYGAVGTALGMLAAHLTLVVVAAWVGRDLLTRVLVRPAAAAAAGGLVLAGALLALAGLPLGWRLVLGVAACVAVTAGILGGRSGRRARATGS